MRLALACVLALTTIMPAITVPASAASERSLYLYYTHTKETARITFKRNGRYVKSGLDELNWFLRDWRRDEPTDMDPALFDLIWEVYQGTGTDKPIHVVSAYRAPQTNAMLAANSSGVADNSQHIRGKALDFYIPGVPVSRIRELGFRIQGGGVGYYPRSNSPFVHLDTGSVRAWPRMTTAQLRQIFPDGRTLHVPSNGNVLSQEGRAWAQAQYSQCRRVPCNAGPSLTGSGTTQVASNDRDTSGNRPTRTLFDLFTGGGADEAEDTAGTQVASAPTQRSTTSVAVAPSQPEPLPDLPPERPQTADTETAIAQAQPQDVPFEVREGTSAGATQVAALIADAEGEPPAPPAISNDLARMRAETPSVFSGSNEGTLAIAALEADAPEPQPRPQFASAVNASAYAAASGATADLAEDASPIAQPSAPDPVMRPALTDTPTPRSILDADRIETAGINPSMGLESFADLFNGPILPMNGEPDQETANALASLQVRPGELHAPDISHVTETMLEPVSVASAHFSFMTQPDNADFDPSTHAGGSGAGFSGATALGIGASSFSAMPSILVTLR